MFQRARHALSSQDWRSSVLRGLMENNSREILQTLTVPDKRAWSKILCLSNRAGLMSGACTIARRFFFPGIRCCLIRTDILTTYNVRLYCAAVNGRRELERDEYCSDTLMASPPRRPLYCCFADPTRPERSGEVLLSRRRFASNERPEIATKAFWFPAVCLQLDSSSRESWRSYRVLRETFMSSLLLSIRNQRGTISGHQINGQRPPAASVLSLAVRNIAGQRNSDDDTDSNNVAAAYRRGRPDSNNKDE